MNFSYFPDTVQKEHCYDVCLHCTSPDRPWVKSSPLKHNLIQIGAGISHLSLKQTSAPCPWIPASERDFPAPWFLCIDFQCGAFGVRHLLPWLLLLTSSVEHSPFCLQQALACYPYSVFFLTSHPSSSLTMHKLSSWDTKVRSKQSM